MVNMKDTRNLSVIYFMISLVLLLMVCFGCSNPVSVDYIHSVNEVDVYYTEANNPDEVLGTVNKLLKHSDNFVLQSDFGIIEVENGEIVYNNIK
nr:MAG TPA: SurA N-terminal domain [Caudoviricetes sp.]